MYGQAAIKEPFVLAGGKQGIFCTGDGPTTSQDKRGYTFHTSPAPGADGTGQDGGNNPHQGSAGATLQPKERWFFPPSSIPLVCSSHVRTSQPGLKGGPPAIQHRLVPAEDHHKYLWSTSQKPRQRLFILVLKHPAAISYILKRTFHLRPSLQLWN